MTDKTIQLKTSKGVILLPLRGPSRTEKVLGDVFGVVAVVLLMFWLLPKGLAMALTAFLGFFALLMSLGSISIGPRMPRSQSTTKGVSRSAYNDALRELDVARNQAGAARTKLYF